MDEDNDGRFPDDSPVEIRYPRSRQEENGDRSAWPCLPGSIVNQCGPDEWYVCVEAPELVVGADGRPGGEGPWPLDLDYPCSFRATPPLQPPTALPPLA